MDFLSAFKYKLSHSSYFNNLLMSQARSTCLHTVAKSFLEFQLIPQIVFPIGTDGKDLSILLLYFHLTHEFLPLYQEVRSLVLILQWRAQDIKQLMVGFTILGMQYLTVVIIFTQQIIIIIEFRNEIFCQ